MDNGIGKRETPKNEYIVSFTKAMANTKTSASGNNATLEPGTYVLKTYLFSKDATVWNIIKVNDKKVYDDVSTGTYEFTVTTESEFTSYWLIDGSYGCVSYVLYKKLDI